jgi:flagellar basal body-associated protein FliL
MQAGFTQMPPQPSGGKKVVLGILIFLIVLLILSGIGFGVWYFFIKEDEESTALGIGLERALNEGVKSIEALAHIAWLSGYVDF